MMALAQKLTKESLENHDKFLDKGSLKDLLITTLSLVTEVDRNRLMKFVFIKEVYNKIRKLAINREINIKPYSIFFSELTKNIPM